MCQLCLDGDRPRFIAYDFDEGGWYLEREILISEGLVLVSFYVAQQTIVG
jgi:hypothetical protein